jgi:hypothetical protein
MDDEVISTQLTVKLFMQAERGEISYLTIKIKLKIQYTEGFVEYIN